MRKEITVEINFENLPDKPNHHKLAVALEEEINNAVATALCNTTETDRASQVDFTVRVPSF